MINERNKLLCSAELQIQKDFAYIILKKRNLCMYYLLFQIENQNFLPRIKIPCSNRDLLLSTNSLQQIPLFFAQLINTI